MQAQFILDDRGKPAFAVIPYDVYLKEIRGIDSSETLPHDVAMAHAMEGKSLLQAWRDHFRLTQQEVADRIGLSQANYAQMEKPGRKLRRDTRHKVAKALGIVENQLNLED